MQKYGIIYKITNKTNGKVYIGQTTKPLLRRWAEHKYASRKGSSLIFHKAIRKYGFNNFEVEEVSSVFDIETINKLEEDLIKSNNSLAPFGYNMTYGGKTSKRTDIAKQKLSKARGGSSVIAKNLLTGEIRHYSHIRQTAKDGFSSGHVRDVISGKIKALKKWIFVYGETEADIKDRYASPLVKRSQTYKSRSVIQTTPEGERIEHNSSYIEGFNQANVWMCCERKQKMHLGHTFAWGNKAQVLKLQNKDETIYTRHIASAATAINAGYTSIQRSLQSKRPTKNWTATWEWVDLTKVELYEP
jgi:group I intron endonuclease